jgi:uncharacterized repeat protein (TIGR03803 family)
VLYTFCSHPKPPSDRDGSYPEASLLMDVRGNLYGTTTTGGTSEQGVVFRLAGRVESVLYNFCSNTGCGEIPVAGVVMDKAGNLYGTTRQGGSGFGTVFELKR